MRRAIKTLIIGGTAAYGFDLSPWRPQGDPFQVQTPYGESPVISLLQPEGASTPVAFCSRHGRQTLARSAAFLNHRAIVWAARKLGVTAMLSWNGVGAIHERLEVGDLVVPSDLIDFTRKRVTTFGHPKLSPAAGPAFHPQVRSAIIEAAANAQIRETSSQRFTLHEAGVYVCTEGPRLETETEIKLYRHAGADIVGMTLSPEVFLAQEAGIRYASLCYVTNFATGRALGRPPKRDFGPNVAQTCLPILIAAANLLTD